MTVAPYSKISAVAPLVGTVTMSIVGFEEIATYLGVQKTKLLRVLEKFDGHDDVG